MIPEEEIQANVKGMGYVTAKPLKVEPSYYKIVDGTVIKAIANIHYLLPDPKSPQGYSINSSNTISAYVPMEKRNPMGFQPYDPSQLKEGIIEEDIETETLRENFSVYELSNDMILSVKTVVGQINKTKFYTQEGEPVYIVNTNPIIKVKKRNS